jgi:hypothetical protein
MYDIILSVLRSIILANRCVKQSKTGLYDEDTFDDLLFTRNYLTGLFSNLTIQHRAMWALMMPKGDKQTGCFTSSKIFVQVKRYGEAINATQDALMDEIKRLEQLSERFYAPCA